MPLIELNGVSLHYDVSGRANEPVLMLSSSLGTTAEMWMPQVREFERDYRVLRYDMRGHGRSSTPPGPYTIEQLAGDVTALLDSLGLESVDFCGLSLGGMIGQWIGAHNPARVKKLVLCNTAAKIGTAETWNARIASVESGGMAAIADGVIERWFTSGFRSRSAPAVDLLREMLAGTDPKGYVAACAAIREMDQRATAASIPRPTLIVAGAFDPVTTVADSQFLHDRIPGSKMVAIPAAHISNIEAEQEFNKAVREFLSDGSNY